MISDLFTLAAIVPLEKRSKVEARKQEAPRDEAISKQNNDDARK